MTSPRGSIPVKVGGASVKIAFRPFRPAGPGGYKWDVVVVPTLIAAQAGSLRGMLTALATLAVVAVCFLAVELIGRRADSDLSGSRTGSLAALTTASEAPGPDAWPARRAGRSRRVHRAPAVTVTYAVAGSIVALIVAAVLIPVRSTIGSSSVALALVLVVVGVAVLGGRTSAAVVSAVAALCFNFLHAAPLYTFHIAEVSDVTATVLMIVIGVVVGGVADRGAHESAPAATDGGQE